MRFKAKYLGLGVLFLGAVAVLGWVVMVLWNAIVPGVFDGIRPLGYGQALGLLLLSRILVGGFRGRGGFRGGRRWQRLENLTPEERAHFQSNPGRRL
jgi:hypothetical protein